MAAWEELSRSVLGPTVVGLVVLERGCFVEKRRLVLEIQEGAGGLEAPKAPS